jgi:hypothetical protein
VIACTAGAIFLPPMVGNFGLGLKSGGPLGVEPYSDGLALQRTYVGEIAAVNKICAAIPPDTSVLIADYTMMQQFGQAIRGMCGVPVAGVTAVGTGNTIPASKMIADVRAIENDGRHPMVLAPASAALAPLGSGRVALIMNQYTTIDERNIFGTPRNPVPQVFTAYSWEPK